MLLISLVELVWLPDGLQCFTVSAMNLGETVDIFKLWLPWGLKKTYYILRRFIDRVYRYVFTDIYHLLISRFLHISTRFWYVDNGTIFKVLNLIHPDSTIKFCTEWASCASTIHTNVCSNPEWYCCNIFILFLVRTLSSCSAIVMTSLLTSTLLSGQLSGEWLPYIPYDPIGNAWICCVITIFLLVCPPIGFRHSGNILRCSFNTC